MHITIDFWQTIYSSSNGPARNEQRREVLYEAILAENQAPGRERFDEVYAGLWDFFDYHWLEKQRTPTSEEMVVEMLGKLDVSLSTEPMAEVVRVYEDGILDYPPALLPGVRDGLTHLASLGPLAIISDTAFSPGSVLKQLMERDGIAEHFDHYIFSDETGVAKPHPDAFNKALEGIGGNPESGIHIGDIERTDVVGAKGVGMAALLYRSPDEVAKYAEKETVADAVLHHWDEVAEVVSSVVGSR